MNYDSQETSFPCSPFVPGSNSEILQEKFISPVCPTSRLVLLLSLSTLEKEGCQGRRPFYFHHNYTQNLPMQKKAVLQCLQIPFLLFKACDKRRPKRLQSTRSSKGARQSNLSTVSVANSACLLEKSKNIINM